MTYEDFKKSLNTFFKPYGFRRHSTHFHCEASDGVMVVFGVYKSVYDTDLCYMEYGYAFFPPWMMKNLNSSVNCLNLS